MRNERNRSLHQSPAQIQKPGSHSVALPFPRWRNNGPSIQPYAIPEHQVMPQRQAVTLTHLSGPKLLFFFFLQWHVGTSPREIWTSTRAISSEGGCLSHCSACTPRLQLRGWNRFSLLQVSQLVLKSLCLLPSSLVGQLFCVSLGVWCCIPQLTRRHFRWGKQKQGMCCTAMMLILPWFRFSIFILINFVLNVHKRFLDQRFLIYQTENDQ